MIAALYLWYIDPDGDEQWVPPATPSASDIAGTYVAKAGDTMTGGLVINRPGGSNLALDVQFDGTSSAYIATNGSARFANEKVIFKTDGSATFASHVKIGGNSPTTILYSDGGATFSSNVQVGGDPNAGATNGTKNSEQ